MSRNSDDTSGLNEFCPLADAPALDVFDQALSDLLSQETPTPYPLLHVIQRTLCQYHLADQYEAHEILHEAYLRGKKKLRAGETIRNPYAWLKATSVNVIYERKRKHRASATEPQVLEASLADPRLNLMQQQMLSEEIDQLYTAMNRLHQEDPEGACLLYLRLVKGLSWSEICQWLAATGRPVASEAALRQRASRAKRRLRDIASKTP